MGQVLDAAERLALRIMVVSEELLEMTAALLLTLTFGLALRALRAERARGAA